jgi:colicin import membrane protein
VNRRQSPQRSSWKSWSLSILLHLAIVAIAVGFWLWSKRNPEPQRLSVQGSVVSSVEFEERAPAVAEPAPVPAPEELPPEPAPEPVAEEPPPPEEDPALLQAEADRLAEQERLATEQRLAEAQRVHREAEQQAQRERERVERERLERERVERERVERERLARERAERERQQREETERARREAELDAQLAAEQQRAALRNSGQARQYMDLIRARIERAWVRPPTARVGLECEVRVTQVPGGTVTRVSIGRCNGDETVRQSIEAAVHRASPLPQPPDPALFESELIFNFAPEN